MSPSSPRDMKNEPTAVRMAGETNNSASKVLRFHKNRLNALFRLFRQTIAAARPAPKLRQSGDARKGWESRSASGKTLSSSADRRRQLVERRLRRALLGVVVD